MPAEPSSTQRTGFLAAVSAYAIWGLAPLFWALLRHIDSFEVLAHRILWSAVLAFIVLRTVDPDLGDLRRLKNFAVVRTMAASTALIAVNWFVFIWGVTHDRVTEVSLGYYTNPLINVLLGRLVLGERLSSLQGIAVGLAALGVGYLTWSFGSLPWVSLALALSFGSYGLVRKQASLPALSGLAVETGVCAPLCLGYLAFGLEPSFGAARTGTPEDLALLMLGGVMTATPLLLFAVGARRLEYSTLGMVQYIAPTLQLACAALAFGEPFTSAHAVTFACIWAAVGLYGFDALRAWRRG